MSDLQNKHSFLLSMSLTELGFILFFLLLLASSWKLKDMKAQRDAARELTDGAMAEKAQLSEEIKELKVEDAVYKAYKEHLDKLGRVLPDDFKELVRDSRRALAQKRQLEGALRESRMQNEELREKNQQLASSVLDLTGQVRSYQRRFGQGGHDFPPCWTDASGRIEYIYRVVIKERALSVEPAWPDRRADDLNRIPGARRAVGGPFSIEEFRNRAAPILSWSKKREPECRHFVILIDQAVTKDSFKAKRFAVEDYFYKYEPRS